MNRVGLNMLATLVTGTICVFFIAHFLEQILRSLTSSSIFRVFFDIPALLAWEASFSITMFPFVIDWISGVTTACHNLATISFRRASSNSSYQGSKECWDVEFVSLLVRSHIPFSRTFGCSSLLAFCKVCLCRNGKTRGLVTVAVLRSYLRIASTCPPI